MATPHEWQECYPAILKLGDAPTDNDAVAMRAAVQQAWARTPPEDRHAFHRFCCEDARDPFTMHAVQRFRDRINAFSN